MVVLHKLLQSPKGYNYFKKFNSINLHNCMPYCTIVEHQKSRSLLKFSLIGVCIGITGGIGYSYYKVNEAKQNYALEGTPLEIKTLKYKPPISPSRQITFPVDTTGLKLTLYQYQTCPFCCKVRIFLDYYGISYDVVEVDPVFRQGISWSSYKKVPILLAKVKDGYQPLNDSSMIISLLSSHLHDKSHRIEDLVNYYPSIGIYSENGQFKYEVMNKYFLMYEKDIPKDRSLNDVTEERKWRQWADEVLVHTLSPNVYRTLDEAYETFSWFSDVGNWKEYFPFWERMIIINVGACAMWLIAKRLKKRHNLKEDVRQTLYDEINYWLKHVKARGTPFMGGQNPDLSDLAVYGVLKSIEGCSAFKDLLKYTKISNWYDAMKERVDTNSGSAFLNM